MHEAKSFLVQYSFWWIAWALLLLTAKVKRKESVTLHFGHQALIFAHSPYKSTFCQQVHELKNRSLNTGGGWLFADWSKSREKERLRAREDTRNRPSRSQVFRCASKTLFYSWCSEMDGFCQVESLKLLPSDDTVGVYERQAEPEHDDLDWDSFTTSLPLHQVDCI